MCLPIPHKRAVADVGAALQQPYFNLCLPNLLFMANPADFHSYHISIPYLMPSPAILSQNSWADLSLVPGCFG